jgi:hypothetical protein
MKQTRTRRAILAATVFVCGTVGSIEWQDGRTPPQHFPRGDFSIAVSTAAAGETRGTVRRVSCALVRYYLARYSAAVAEAWARSRGATDNDIQMARSCVGPQLTAQVGQITD